MARGIAAALANQELRTRLVDDMRDSPFEKHAVHLASYLSGRDGATLLQLAAAGANVTPSEFLRLVGSIPNAAAWIPSTHTRFTWTGTADVVVTAVSMPIREISAAAPTITGFDVSASPLLVPTRDPLEFPLILIAPTDVDFGVDPEALRHRAPPQSRRTVSAPGDVRENPDRPGDGFVPMVGGGLPGSVWCHDPSFGDNDGDLLWDGCEESLAYAFRPFPYNSTTDCDLTKEPYFAAKRRDAEIIDIFYLFAYPKDCGDDLFGGGHVGDSEFMVVSVRDPENLGTWSVVSVFFSAHYGEINDASIYANGADVQFSGSRPITWVAEGKHGNYKTQVQCDQGGALSSDYCGRNVADGFFDLWSNSNIGNLYLDYAQGTALINCVASRFGAPGPECFWGPLKFCGWYPYTTSGSNSYMLHLQDFHF